MSLIVCSHVLMKDVSRGWGPKAGWLLSGHVLLGVLLELVVLEVLYEEGGRGHVVDGDLAGQLVLVLVLQLMLLMLKCQIGLQLLMGHKRDGWGLVVVAFLLGGLRRVWLGEFFLRRQD